LADAPELFEAERRRLAGMLPGADIEYAGAAADGAIEVIAHVDDVDRPMPVLVERGGYAYSEGGEGRRLHRPGFRLTLRTRTRPDG
jgi:hypothetical protein